MAGNTNDNDPKPKKKNTTRSEKRKLKSRDAARCRRSREHDIFNSLLEQLPASCINVGQIDKAMIIRLVLGFVIEESFQPVRIEC